MKLFFKTFFFCFFVVLCLKFLDASKDSVILDGNNYDQVDGLLFSDGSVQATQKYKDIMLSGYGRINLTLDDAELIFEVCPNFNCAVKSKVCFETTETGIQTKLECFEVPSYCTFEVHKEGEKIFFGETYVLKRDFGGSCLYPKIHTGYVTAVGTSNFESCEPKIVDKMIKLYVSIDPSCPITVKNAKIHAPPTTSTTKVPPPNKSPPNDSAEASSFPDWGYAILAIAALIVVAGIIGCIAFYFYNRRQSSKRASQKPDETIPKATVSKADVAVNVETPTKKNYDLEAAKVEPIQIPKKDKKKTTETLEAAKVEPIQKPKKDKKTKTQEPTTTEEIHAPTVEQQEPPTQIPKKNQKKKTETTEDVPAPTVSKQEPPAPASKEPAPTEQPPPNPTERPPPAARGYPVVKRLIPRGMKSSKTDSLDETLKIDKTAMVESLVDAAGNHCLKSDESDVLREMKAAYPKNVQHDIMPSEVDLLCLPVSKMFEEMDSMAHESEQKLADAGCEFAERHCIVSVSPEARRLLKDAKTDATTVCFAFGAEFYEYITDDPDIMEKASIPLLYAIALQPRFPEASRRKACAIMRRKLVRVLGYFKAADRAKMPFPVNIVENAYCKDPKYFYEPSGIKTYSGSDGKKKQIAVGKRKKKSSKKR